MDAAGGVVVSSTKRPRVLLLMKDGKGGHWVLPKGKRQIRERRRSAAKREVLEETGLVQVDVGRFLVREHYFDREGKNVLFKQVSYFLMSCPKGKTRLKVNRAEGFTRGSWMSFDAALAATSPLRAHLTLRKARIAARNG